MKLFSRTAQRVLWKIYQIKLLTLEHKLKVFALKFFGSQNQEDEGLEYHVFYDINQVFL